MVTRQQVDEQKALNIERAERPQPGDYWDEMFAPMALVLDVTPFHVTYLGNTKDADRRHWTWDVEKVTVKSRADFKKWISYGSIPGTWADVTPRWKHFEDFRDAAVQHASGVQPALPAFDDPRVQAVYAVLCDEQQPPQGEHWEGFAARRIVAAIAGVPQRVAGAQEGGNK